MERPKWLRRGSPEKTDTTPALRDKEEILLDVAGRRLRSATDHRPQRKADYLSAGRMIFTNERLIYIAWKGSAKDLGAIEITWATVETSLLVRGLAKWTLAPRPYFLYLWLRHPMFLLRLPQGQEVAFQVLTFKGWKQAVNQLRIHHSVLDGMWQP